MYKWHKLVLVTEGPFRISPEGIEWLRTRFQERGCTLKVSSDGYKHMTRHDEDLVQMVETLGEAAGKFRVHQILGNRYLLHRNIDGSEETTAIDLIRDNYTVIYGD